MRVAPVEQRRKKYLILPRGLAAHCAVATGACVLYATRIHATRETECFPIFPKDPASKTSLPEFSGLRVRDGAEKRARGGGYFKTPPFRRGLRVCLRARAGQNLGNRLPPYARSPPLRKPV